MKTIYLSGPISGIKNNNRDSFFRAKDYYESLGYNVINPIEIADAMHIVNEGLNDPEPREIDIMAEDIKSLSECDSIILLPNWENSKGARFELAFALSYDIPVFEAYSNLEINITCGLYFEKISENDEVIIAPIDIYQ